MPINPQEFALLLFESVIPDEIKTAVVNELLPKMSSKDIKDLYEILKIENKEKGKIKRKLEKQLDDMAKMAGSLKRFLAGLQ